MLCTRAALRRPSAWPTMQHKEGYAPLQWRMASAGLTTFASPIVLWVPVLGMFTGFLNTGLAVALVATAWGILMRGFSITAISRAIVRSRSTAAAADRHLGRPLIHEQLPSARPGEYDDVLRGGEADAG